MVRREQAKIPLILGIVTILLMAVSTGNPAAAQQLPQWLPLERVPDYLDDTFTPYLLADQNRTVHAFANQWVAKGDWRLAILYRQWTLDGGWTKPMDILLSPVGRAQVLGAFLDQTGTMHLVFWGGDAQGANIYYSRAPAVNAGQAPAWSKPELVGHHAVSPVSGALVGDNKGNLVIIYNGNAVGNGVYAIQSYDAGDSWSEPVPVFLTSDSELTPYSLHATMDQASQLHAVWNVVTSLGTDVSVHYASLDVAGQKWSDPILLEERLIEEEGFFGPSFPVIADSGDKLVVMYNSGNPNTGGRVDAGRPVQRVRVSYDRGRTWREPTTPFPRHQGRSGEHTLVVDSNNVVHALFIQRIDQTTDDGDYSPIAGMWHSELSDTRWTEPDRLDLGDFSGHDLRAVISQGNILLATMREDPGAGEIGVWYSRTFVNAPELPVVPLPSPTATPTAVPTPTPTPPAPTPTPPHRPASISHEPGPTGATDNPAIPLVLGLVPVVLLVVGFIMMQQLLYHRHH
jgi:hypothetical protein